MAPEQYPFGTPIYEREVLGVPPVALERPSATTHAAASSKAVYRATDADAWQDCEIVGYTPGGVVLREAGKLWPGVWAAPLDRVRLQGRVFEFNEPFGNERKAA